MVRAVSLQASDFQRALGSRPVSRTAHFVLHALPVSVSPDPAAELSTGQTPPPEPSVDDSCLDVSDSPVVNGTAWRLGLVLPKKQARRSVTRSLIRHQAREALRRHGPAVWQAEPQVCGRVDGWVVRLRSPFDQIGRAHV